MKFFDETGMFAMGARVRYLAEVITQDAAEIYRLYGTNLQPKWFPVFYILSHESDCSAAAIAERIGHSHASVSKILGEMSEANLIKEKVDPADRRRTVLSLSKRGKEIAEMIGEQYDDVGAAIKEISMEANNNLWEALREWEYLLEKKSLLKRVTDIRKKRESADVKIVSFTPKYQKAFKDLNEEWIKAYFEIEEADRIALDSPKKYILDRGGFIYVALLGGEPIGVCALMKRDDLGRGECYELAKMAVSPKAQGKSIGYLLGTTVIEKAKELKASRLFLESNTILKPAINLYEKLGFKKITGRPSPYARSNIQMELELK